MNLPRPTLDSPATGNADKWQVSLEKLQTALRLNIPNEAELALTDGRVYAFLCSEAQNTDDQIWSGSRDFGVEASEYVPPPGDEMDAGTYKRIHDLQVEIPKHVLAAHPQETLHVGYSSAGDSDPVNSATLELQIQ